jgi:hypothetical protein
MSHKIAKAKRKMVHQLMPEVLKMPKSLTEGTYEGKFKKITVEQQNIFKKRMGYFPIATQHLTDKCRKYWYNKA